MSIDRTSPLEHRAALHRALGDPGRLALVDVLALGDASPSALQQTLGMSSNLLSHHVDVLVEAAGIAPSLRVTIAGDGPERSRLEDRANAGLPALSKTAYAIMGMAAKDPRLQNVFTQFRINSPQVQIDIDRDKAKAIGISLTDIFDTLEVQLASLFVNNFTYLNRSWQVNVQADEPYRNRVSSLRGLFVSSGSAANAAIPSGTNPFPTPVPGAATAGTNATGTVMTPLLMV